MKSEVEICPHCFCNFRARVSDDIIFRGRIDGRRYLTDVVLVVEDLSIRGGRITSVLLSVFVGLAQ